MSHRLGHIGSERTKAEQEQGALSDAITHQRIYKWIYRMLVSYDC